MIPSSDEQMQADWPRRPLPGPYRKPQVLVDHFPEICEDNDEVTKHLLKYPGVLDKEKLREMYGDRPPVVRPPYRPNPNINAEELLRRFEGVTLEMTYEEKYRMGAHFYVVSHSVYPDLYTIDIDFSTSESSCDRRLRLGYTIYYCRGFSPMRFDKSISIKTKLQALGYNVIYGCDMLDYYQVPLEELLSLVREEFKDSDFECRCEHVCAKFSDAFRS